MVSPSTIVGAVLALALSTLSSACAATKAPPTAAGCADEFYEGTATYSDGSVHQFCAPARADGIVLFFENSFRCRIRSAGGTGYTREGAWEVGGDYQWLDTTGSKELHVGYQPSFDSHPSFCPTGVSGCAFRSDRCRFDVTRSAAASGGFVEGHLTSPCLLEPSPGNPAPTVTALRFRVHVGTQANHDAGVCSYPP